MNLLLVMEQPSESDAWMVARFMRGVPHETLIIDGDYYAFRDRMSTCVGTIVVPIGGLALRYCTGLTNILDWRGYIISPSECKACSIKVPKIKKDGTLAKTKQTISVASCLPQDCRHIIPTIDPETVRKSGKALAPVMGADLDRATRFAANPELPISADTDFKFYRQPCVPLGPAVALDVETDLAGKVTHLALASPGMTSSVEWSGFALALKSPTTVAHNAAFDYEALARMGVAVTRTKWWCSMLAAYMLNPDGKKSLNWVISQYLDARRHKHLAGKDFQRYNALDAAQTIELYPKLRAGLERTGQLEFFEHGMMPALPSLVGMHMRGIKLDKEFVLQWEAELNANLVRVAGDKFDFYSKPLKQAKFFGTKNADEETLLKLKLKGHPDSSMIDEILEFRALAMQHRTYCLPNVGRERVYPNYVPGDRDSDEGNRGIAYSGRPTAHKPNIQNQPKAARRMYVADTGHCLVSLDWSQIEPRIAAAMSKDDVFAADIEAGLYDAVSNTLQCPRDVAKTVVLLSAYLGSPRVLQDKLMLNGIHKKYGECKRLQDRMFERYKRWHAWRQEIIERAEREGCLTNPFGKWAPFYRSHPAKAVNFFPQSGAACILYYSLPQVEKAIAPLGGTPWATVHDEITIQAPLGNVEEAARVAQAVMQQTWPQLGISVPVKMKMGGNWRDMAELV